MIEFFICLLITVMIHEIGHLVVALKCGIGVKAFSIGFGKPYLHKTIKGIDYRLSPILLGGYCDLKGMESKKDKDDFLSHPYKHKFAVLVAGVCANFALACVCYLINYGSIAFGLHMDLIYLKLMFAKEYYQLAVILDTLNPNLFLVQLSILNIFCAVTNLIPIVPLDGGYLWFFILYNKLSTLIKKILQIGGWWFIIILQIWVVLWIYFL